MLVVLLVVCQYGTIQAISTILDMRSVSVVVVVVRYETVLL